MKNTRIRERGTVVVIALALLALMLILIMSFVTNALLESRIAETKNYQAQSKNITETALNRALASLRYYINSHAEAINRFNNFVSWEDNDSDNPVDTDDLYKDVIEGSITDEKYKYYVGLQDAMDTFLTQNLKNDKVYLYRYPTNFGSTFNWVEENGRSFKEQPRWQYLTSLDAGEDPDDDSDDETIITGRFAYAVLPDKGQLNINSFVGDFDPAVHNRTGETTDEFAVEQLITDEFGFFENNRNDLASLEIGTLAPKYKLTSDAIATFRLENPSAQNADVSYFVDKNFNGDDKDINTFYQKFVFNGELYPSDGEKFWLDKNGNGEVDTDEMVDRFNFANYNWDDNGNSADKVEDILELLPFLNLIGDSSESFSSIATRRNQIAANLLDLGDYDKIPTSNIAADLWSLNNAPEYTGNEMTPYISEMALNMSIGLDGGILKNLVFTLRPEFELIDFYQGNGEYDLEFGITNISGGTLTLEEGTVKVTVSYLNNRFQLRSATLDVPLSAISNKLQYNIANTLQNFATNYDSGDISYLKVDSSTESMEVSHSTDTSLKAKLFYLFGDTSASNLPTAELNYSLQLTTWGLSNMSAFRSYASSHLADARTILTATPTELVEITGVKLSGVTITIGNVLLKNDDGGVDYIKLNTAYTIDESTITSSTPTPSFNLIKLSSSDSRQNLNANDWSRPETKAVAITIDDTPTLWGKSADNTFDWTLEDAANFNMKYNNSEDDITDRCCRYSMLSLVHTGKKGETLNILEADNPINRGQWDKYVWKANYQEVGNNNAGTTADQGEGGILNQIALNSDAPQKINIVTASKDIWRGLLYNLKYDSDGDGSLDAEIFDNDADFETFIDNITRIIAEDPSKLRARSDLVTLIDEAWDKDATSPYSNITSELSDLKKYGIIDGIMHLVKVEQFPEEFKILIVAQAIKDAGGASSGNGIKLTKTCDCGETVATDDARKAKLGEFDFVECANCHKIFYFDEILSEEKILVTIRRVGKEFKIIKKEKLPF